MAELLVYSVKCLCVGEQGGTALANILFGKVNPSGKLSVSFPTYVGSLPAYYNYPKAGRPVDPGKIYPNGTMVFGYQYTLGTPEPIWYFGHGKPYTTFEYKSISLSKNTVSQNEKEIIAEVRLLDRTPSKTCIFRLASTTSRSQLRTQAIETVKKSFRSTSTT